MGRTGAVLGFLLLLPWAAHAEQEKEVLVSVRSAPAHGLVVAEVDLTPAVRWVQAGPVAPAGITAIASGKQVPLQFIPAPDFDPRQRIAGTAILHLPSGGDHQVRLKLVPSEARPPQPWAGTVETRFYRMQHDPQKMGGLPWRIEFRPTSKVFDTFVWNDRVHHPEKGGFLLRYDHEAQVELVSQGPLATVVRVRARYRQDGGARPASEPKAVYDWFYFRDLPLIYVTAAIEQREPFAWSELHFLELNYPDESFRHWAGGEPLTEGEFTGAGKSLPFGRWGALLDGTNAIAVLDSGQALFHDGRGAYGTYLHAHGSEAWAGWRETRRRFGAWLWVGAQENPVAALRAALDWLPDAAQMVATAPEVHAAVAALRRSAQSPQARWHAALAEQLETQGRFAEALELAAGRMPMTLALLEAGDLKLALEIAGKNEGLRLQSLFDVKAGRELASAQPLPLFAVTLRHPGTGEERVLSASEGWLEVREERVPGGLGFRFVQPIGETEEWISVLLKAVAEPAAGAVRWSLQVRNDTDSWSVWRVTFPQISVAEPAPQAKVLFPRGPGEVQHGIWRKAFNYTGLYPNGWTTMQFMAAYDDGNKTGLYVAMHDPLGSTKDIELASRPQERAVAFRFSHPAPNMGRPGNSFLVSGQAVWQLLRGDWYDAAIIYRDWVRREAKWYPELGPEGREDTPAWMRELPAWALTGGAPGECVEAVKEYARLLGVPVGFHWYNWHQIPFDNDYPHYFPTKEGFRDGVRALQEAGVFVMPYINGRLWDTRDRGMEDFEFSRVAWPAVTKNEQGQPYTEVYGSKEADGSSVALGVMCPSTRLWRQRVGGIVGRLFQEEGVKGVYIDQVAAAAPALCFDAAHGHPLGGGHWWVQGYGKMLEAVRAAKPADRILTTECNAEPFLRWFDGYLTWHWQHDEQVPAFPAVYGGAIQMFSRAYGGGPTANLALRMKAGQQFVFGEQIGWMDPALAKQPENLTFLKQVVGLRWRFRRYFHAGEMVRPPRLQGDIPQVRADWQWSGEWWVTNDAALTGAWRLSREGKVLILLVNTGDEPVTARLTWKGEEYGLRRETVTVTPWTAEGEGAAFAAPRSFDREITIPGRTAWAWEVQ